MTLTNLVASASRGTPRRNDRPTNVGLIGRRLAMLAALTLVSAACTADDPDPNVALISPDGSAEIVMSEFAFLPSDLTVTAGSVVTLTLINDGSNVHEFMVGQNLADGGGYLDDLLVRTLTGADGTRFETAGLTLEGHDEGVGADGDAEDVPAEDHTEDTMDTAEDHTEDTMNMDDMDDTGGVNGHAGHSGAAVSVQSGGQVQLVLDVPTDAVGVWEIGCFVEGHYEAGMHATLTILPAAG